VYESGCARVCVQVCGCLGTSVRVSYSGCADVLQIMPAVDWQKRDVREGAKVNV
jgi:hypothetical protein